MVIVFNTQEILPLEYKTGFSVLTGIFGTSDMSGISYDVYEKILLSDRNCIGLWFCIRQINPGLNRKLLTMTYNVKK